MIPTDRSRIETFQRCPRLYYHEYDYRTVGVSLGDAEHLDIGSSTHEGIAAVLLAVRDGLPLSHPDVLQIELNGARNAPEYAGLSPEARELTEALVLTWHAAILPKLDGWQILEVEREERFEYEGVVLLSRLDLLATPTRTVRLGSRNIEAGGLYNWNWKTAKRIDDRWRESWLYAMQPLTELLGPEQRLGRKLAGFLAGGLVKENHPLVWAWRSSKDGGLALRRWWKCYEAHENTHTKRGGLCSGGKTHRLGDEYEAVRVSEVVEGGMAAQYQRILNEDPLLLAEFAEVVGPLSRRSDYEIERWCRQNLLPAKERAAVREETPLSDDVLDRWYPQHTARNNCMQPWPCAAKEICWGARSPEEFPWRKSNHPAEADCWAARDLGKVV